jgi:hypothetical protein
VRVGSRPWLDEPRQSLCQPSRLKKPSLGSMSDGCYLPIPTTCSLAKRCVGGTYWPSLMQFFDEFDLMPQFRHQTLRERDRTILVTFPFSNHDLPSIEIDALDAQAASFHQTKSTPVHQAAHQSLGAGLDRIENLGDFGGGQNDR